MKNNEISHYLSVFAYQFEPQWLKKKENIDEIEQQVNRLSEKPDILVLPEMFTTGFCMEAAKYAETMDGESIEMLKFLAGEHDIAICGSLIIRDKAAYHNRFVFVHPSGKIEYYDKKHLFTMGDESAHYKAGASREIITYKGWNILPLVCYDLRFPVWCRNNQNYDLIICSANWPQARASVWDVLLHARAIENQCYVVGVNRTGTDGNEIEYSGKSFIIDAKGQNVAKAGSTPNMLKSVLNKFELSDFRKAFPVLKDADSFQLF